MSEIKIPIYKPKLFLFMIGSLLFVVAGFYFLIYQPDLSNLIRVNNKMTLAKTLGSFIIGILSLTFFGIIFIMTLKKMLFDKHALSLSENFLIENTFGFSEKKISFSKIEKFTKVTVDKNEFIYIYASNSKELIENQNNIIDRFFMKLNNRFYKTPLMLNKHIIKYNFDELLIVLNKRLENYRRNYE